MLCVQLPRALWKATRVGLGAVGLTMMDSTSTASSAPLMPAAARAAVTLEGGFSATPTRSTRLVLVLAGTNSRPLHTEALLLLLLLLLVLLILLLLLLLLLLLACASSRRCRLTWVGAQELARESPLLARDSVRLLCPTPSLLEEEEEVVMSFPVLPVSEDVYCCTEVRVGSQSLMLEEEEEVEVALLAKSVVAFRPVVEVLLSPE